MLEGVHVVLPNCNSLLGLMCLIFFAVCCCLSLQADQAEDFDVAHCTQIPLTRALSGSKRPRKQGQLKASAEWVETTPKPATRSETKKLAMAECVFADLTLQTPMPVSEAGNDFGPPPPDTTPLPQRSNACAHNLSDIVHELFFW